MGLDSISLATQILCFSIIPPLIALRVFAKYKLHLPFGVDDDYVHGSLHLNIILYENELKMVRSTLLINLHADTYSGGNISHGVYTTRDREIKYKVS
ncbi:hypothetical protein N7494_008350 [Penicillium frequentans]|uniref:Uncharacterized protein n=1 Tax=Penicillium frequentans TaxID=3151616 RepID=A0AAD6GFM3_9EURO|nr:hypothetical protein N7494_008350 [Penicillium glabrum]